MVPFFLIRNTTHISTKVYCPVESGLIRSFCATVCRIPSIFSARLRLPTIWTHNPAPFLSIIQILDELSFKLSISFVTCRFRQPLSMLRSWIRAQYNLMQLRRRCRRCSFVRSSIAFVTCFVITSSLLLFHRLDLNVLSYRLHDRSTVFLVDADDLLDAKISTSSPNIKLLHEDYFNATHLACPYPALTIDNPEIWKHLSPVTQSQPDCEKSPNWVYVENGELVSQGMRRIKDELIVI